MSGGSVTLCDDPLMPPYEAAQESGIPYRTFVRYLSNGTIVPDGTIKARNGQRAKGILRSRLPELRAIAVELADKREQRKKARVENKRKQNVTDELGQARIQDFGPDLEAGIRRVVNNAWLDSTLDPRSPHFNAPSLPYPELRKEAA